MLRFVIRKMLSKKWMVLSLLIGNILLASITAGNPMYTRAVLQRTLTKNLEAFLEEKNAYPGLVSMKFKSYTKIESLIDQYAQEVAEIPENFGLPVLENVLQMSTATMACKTTVCINNDFSACKTRITLRTANYETTCGVNEDFCIGIHKFGRDNRFNNLV